MAFLGKYNNMVEAFLDVNKEHDEEVYRKRINLAENLIDRATSNLNNGGNGGGINITININVNSLKDIESEQVKDLVSTVTNEVKDQLSNNTSPLPIIEEKEEVVIETTPKKKRKQRQLEP